MVGVIESCALAPVQIQHAYARVKEGSKRRESDAILARACQAKIKIRVGAKIRDSAACGCQKFVNFLFIGTSSVRKLKVWGERAALYQ